MNTEELKNFQRCRLDCFCKDLVPDGKYGPLTNWALAFEKLPKNVKRVIYMARAYIGMSEIGTTNKGDFIQMLFDGANMRDGHPWCCAFVSFVLKQLGELKHSSGAYFVSVHAFSNAWAAQHVHTPVPGDIFIIKRNDGTGHIGFVIGVSETEIMTIEGNVKNAVRVGRRDRSKISHYVSLTPRPATLEVNEHAPDFDGADDR